jgi:hypothetical protein
MTDFKIPASSNAAPDFCVSLCETEVRTADHAALVPATLHEPV